MAPPAMQLDTSQWPATATGGGAEVEQQGGAPAGSASGLAGLLQRSRAAATRLLGHQVGASAALVPALLLPAAALWVTAYVPWPATSYM